jgi:hypothetical protein
MLSIVDAIDDAALFGPWFSGPSWATWRAILKAAFAIPMGRRESELFRHVAERDPPRKRVRELWIIAGRRAGKDSVASAIAAWFSAFPSYDGLLRPGEMAMSCSRQATGEDRPEIYEGLFRPDRAPGRPRDTRDGRRTGPQHRRRADGRHVQFPKRPRTDDRLRHSG